MRNTLFSFSAALAAFLIASSPALSFETEIHGQYRFRALDNDRQTLANDGKRSEQTGWREQRLRVAPQLTFDRAKLFSQADFFSASILGHKSDIGSDFALFPSRRGTRSGKTIPDLVDLRHLYLEAPTRVGLLRAGQMPSDWGLGILANGGDRQPPFGANRYGDIADRILFATKPLVPYGSSVFHQNFYTVAAVDTVFRDENASLVDDDLAFQGVLAAFYREYENMHGLYFAGRRQEDRSGAKLNVVAIDTYHNWIREGDVTRTTASFEGVVVLGRTTRIREERAKSGADVRSGGYAVQAGVEYLPLRLGLTLEHGYASGDNDPLDDTVTRLSFDPDHAVGLLLFPEVLANISGYGADRVQEVFGATGDLKDQAEELGVLKPSVPYLPTQGAISGATYVFPVLRYKGPLTDLEWKIGFLAAWLTADFFDPINSTGTPGGGISTSPYGVTQAPRDLGQEFDAGVGYTFNFLGDIGLVFDVEYANFFPGDALRGPSTSIAETSSIQKVEGRFTLKW